MYVLGNSIMCCISYSDLSTLPHLNRTKRVLENYMNKLSSNIR